MDSLTKLLNKKWSLTFAFIPGLNILYQVFCFLFGGLGFTFYGWALPATLLPSGVLLHFLPSGYGFIAIYVFFVALSVLTYFKCKDRTFARDKYLWLRIVILVLPVVLFMSVRILITEPLRKTQEETRQLLEIIIAQDKEEWKKHLHLYHEKSIESVSAARKKLRDSGVELTGSVEDLRTVSYKTSTQKDIIKDITRTEFEAVVTVGGEEYDVKILFMEDEYGKGVKTFEMSPVSP